MFVSNTSSQRLTYDLSKHANILHTHIHNVMLILQTQSNTCILQCLMSLQLILRCAASSIVLLSPICQLFSISKKTGLIHFYFIQRDLERIHMSNGRITYSPQRTKAETWKHGVSPDNDDIKLVSRQLVN